MYYRDYLRLRARIHRKLKEKQKKENSKITIRDLVVYPVYADLTYGESKRHDNQYSDIDVIIRLIDHIQLLANITNLYHQHAYCEIAKDGTYQLKQEYFNDITRLSLYEFSLYGDRPLTLSEFGQIVGAVELIAKSLHDNVHLLLSSFSVLNKKDQILNVTLYVQGGENARVDVVNKNLAHSTDVTYSSKTHFSQAWQTVSLKEYKAGKMLTEHVAHYIIDESDIISTNSVFEVQTRGGARYIQTIDICVDHANQHSKRLFHHRTDIKSIDTTYFVPEQVDQIVTSNSIDLIPASKITTSVLHVDPQLECFDKEDFRRPIEHQDKLSKDVLPQIQLHKYKKMTVENTKYGLIVLNPPFGSDYGLAVYQERALKGYSSTLKPQVNKVNQKIMESHLDSGAYFFPSMPSQREIDAVASVEQLLEQLLNQCKPTWIESVFKTRNYQLKESAKSIINDLSVMFEGCPISKIGTQLFVPVWMKDMKLKLDIMTQGLPYETITKLKTMIDSFQLEITEGLSERIDCSLEFRK